MKERLLRITKSATEFVVKHSPEILTGLGVVGVITSTVMAVEATPKAMELINEEEHEIYKDLKNTCPDNKESLLEMAKLKWWEKVYVCWRVYVPTALSVIATIACNIFSNRISLRRNLSLATLYSVSQAWIEKYQAKVIENVGEKKEKAFRDDIVKDGVDRMPPVKSSQIIITGKGDYPILDEFSGRVFKSTMEDVRKAMNDLNAMINRDNYASVNDFYELIGLDPIPAGNIGWSSSRELLELDFSTQMMDIDGVQVPTMVISFHGTEPFAGFDRFA